MHRRTTAGVDNIEAGGSTEPVVPVRQSRQLRRLSDSLMESEIGPVLIFFVLFLSTYIMWHARGTWIPLLFVWLPLLAIGTLLAPNLTEDILVLIIKVSILPLQKSTWEYLCCFICRIKCCTFSVSCFPSCSSVLSACKRAWGCLLYCLTCNSCFGFCTRSSSGYSAVERQNIAPVKEIARNQNVDSGASIVDEIRALNKLKIEGILDEEEFKMAKAKLLVSKTEN